MNNSGVYYQRQRDADGGEARTSAEPPWSLRKVTTLELCIMPVKNIFKINNSVCNKIIHLTKQIN